MIVIISYSGREKHFKTYNTKTVWRYILLLDTNKNKKGLSVPKATKMQVSTSMWTLLDRVKSLSQIGQKNNAKLLVTAAPPAVCGNRIMSIKLPVYTQRFIMVV